MLSIFLKNVSCNHTALRRRQLLNLLKIGYALLIAVALLIPLGISYTYNMIGFDGSDRIFQAASKISYVGEVLEQRYRGQGYAKNFTAVMKRKRTLVDTTNNNEGFISTNRVVRKYFVNHTIVWYNTPEWMNLNKHNEAMQSKCFYRNCVMTSDNQHIKNASALIFSPHEPMSSKLPVAKSDRNPDQAWIIFAIEAPANFDVPNFGYRHRTWRNTMNWTMTYRMDADIFFPSGMLKVKQNVESRDYSAIFQRKSKHAAWAVSNCKAQSHRNEYVKEMRSAGLHVDIFGRCSDEGRSVEANFKETLGQDYKFYLSFENTFCTDYITEKFFMYYSFDVILVVRGGADYSRILPSDTFIDASNFTSAAKLVDYLLKVGESEELYTQYLKRKDKYSVEVKEYQQKGMCELCERLNHVDEYRSQIDDHVALLHKDICWEPTDISKYHHFHFENFAFYVCIGAVLFLGIILCLKTQIPDWMKGYMR